MEDAHGQQARLWLPAAATVRRLQVGFAGVLGADYEKKWVE